MLNLTLKRCRFAWIALLWGALAFHSYAQEFDYVESPEEEKEKERSSSDDQEPSLRERVFFGGNFGLQFGRILFFDVSPLVGYRLTDRVQIGVGASYQYFQDRRFTTNYSSSVLGGRVFGRYMISEFVFPHAEIESLSFKFRDNLGIPLSRQWYSALLAGVGTAQPIGNKGLAINALVLYNFSYRPNEPSLYTSPWITRVGFVF